MRKIIIKNRKKTNVTDEALYALDQISHKMWREHGLSAPWMHKTFEEFQQAIQGVTMFVALDAETGELLGMHSFRIHHKQKWCYGFRLAISPSAQREGIASQMLEYEAERIKQTGYRYLKGVTATTADWSVRWHLKNGYRIIGYYHAPNNNFANYVFRKQLVPSLLWDSSLFCRCCYLASYAITKLTKDSNGHPNLVGRVLKKMIGKSKAQ